jgi:hypothetical protein
MSGFIYLALIAALVASVVLLIAGCRKLGDRK